MGANNSVEFAREAAARSPKADAAKAAIADEAIWIAESVALAQSVVYRGIPADTHGMPVRLSAEYKMAARGAAEQKIALAGAAAQSSSSMNWPGADRTQYKRLFSTKLVHPAQNVVFATQLPTSFRPQRAVRRRTIERASAANDADARPTYVCRTKELRTTAA